MTRRYTVFGLILDSDLDLGLPEAAPGQAADIAIRRGEIPPPDPAALAHGPLFRATANAAWFNAPEAARFYLADGREIRYAPLPDCQEDNLLLFLLGTCMGVLLFQRDLLVLHGNAIRVGDGVVVCVGRSGAGKSTLAAAFRRRGHAILADDTSVVDDEGRVLPGYPRIKLWRDSAEGLGVDTGALARVRPGLDKFHLPLASIPDQPLPLRHVYILRPEPLTEPRITPLSGLESLRPLRRQTYRIGFLEAMGRKAWHLQRLARLANQVHVALLDRPQTGFDPDALVDRILADIHRGRAG